MREQSLCFCGKVPCECPWNIAVNPSHNVRNEDPPTSRQAAYQDPESKSNQRAKVYVALKDAAWDGLTDDELWRVTGIDRLSSVSKRRGELRDDGEVIASGRVRRTRTGSPAIVWVLKAFVQPVTP